MSYIYVKRERERERERERVKKKISQCIQIKLIHSLPPPSSLLPRPNTLMAPSISANR